MMQIGETSFSDVTVKYQNSYEHCLTIVGDRKNDHCIKKSTTEPELGSVMGYFQLKHFDTND